MTAGQRGTCTPVVTNKRPTVPTSKTSRTLLQICLGLPPKIHISGILGGSREESKGRKPLGHLGLFFFSPEGTVELQSL